jgi:hypothetical protein
MVTIIGLDDYETFVCHKILTGGCVHIVIHPGIRKIRGGYLVGISAITAAFPVVIMRGVSIMI